MKIFAVILMTALLSSSAVFIANALPTPIRIDERLLQDGDVIFRRGTDAVSRAILASDTAGNYSHVGLIVMRQKNAFVLHATPAETAEEGDQVKIEPLTTFISPNRSLAISVLRPRHNAKVNGSRAVSYALSHIGTPFDFSFDDTDDSSLYCTELVWRAYKAAGIQIVDANKLISLPLLASNIVPPSAIFKATDFQEIETFTRERI